MSHSRQIQKLAVLLSICSHSRLSLIIGYDRIDYLDLRSLLFIVSKKLEVLQMKYVLLFYGTHEQQQAWEEISKEARDEQYAQVGRWFMENGPKIGPGNKLQPPHTATSLRFKSDGDPMTPDGDFIEANESTVVHTGTLSADLDPPLPLPT